MLSLANCHRQEHAEIVGRTHQTTAWSQLMGSAASVEPGAAVDAVSADGADVGPATREVLLGVQARVKS